MSDIRRIATQWVIKCFQDMNSTVGKLNGYPDDGWLAEEKIKLKDDKYLAEWCKTTGFRELKIDKKELVFVNPNSTIFIELDNVGELGLTVEDWDRDTSGGIGHYECHGSKGFDPGYEYGIVSSFIISTINGEDVPSGDKNLEYIEWYLNQYIEATIEDVPPLEDDRDYDDYESDYDR